MAFRSPTQSSIGPTGYYSQNPNPMNPNQQQDDYPSGTSPTIRKRPRPGDMHADDTSPTAPTTTNDSFIQDQEANDDGDDDDDDEGEGKKTDKKAGRRKIKIEFIQDKSRRHITFSKRKAGIMKKAYELSTLTGTQVLLLVVSETGLVYTFTTAKLQPLVTQPEGKNLIQACLNAPHGQLPSSGAPGQSVNRMTTNSQPSRNNVPGGLAIGNNKDEDDAAEEDEDTVGSATTPTTVKPRQRRRTSASTAGTMSTPTGTKQSGTSPTSPNQPAPPTSSMPSMHQQGQTQPAMGMSSAQPQHGQPAQQQQPPYAQPGHGPVPNVAYPSPTDAGGYIQGHGQHHPQMMAQYHLSQQHGSQQHPQAQHWGTAAPQAVPQQTQYRR